MKYNLSQLIEHSKKSIELSQIGQSKLNQEILGLDGMSGVKTRHFYNNICSLDNLNYFEVGTWKGSSFISAIYENKINSLAVDNWSEFGGPKIEFMNNLNRFCKDCSASFIEKDCFKITNEEITNKFDSIDVYLYDGCHKYESHKKSAA